MTSHTDIISIESAVHLAGLFAERVKRSPDDLACRQFDDLTQTWQVFSWEQMDQSIAIWRAALANEKLNVGDRVAIMLKNCREWVFFDIAALSLGLVTVPLFPNDHAENAAYILADSGAKLLLLEDFSQQEELAKQPVVVGLNHIVSLKHASEVSLANAISLENWLPDNKVSVAAKEGIDPHDLASIVYTSGTTGPPKGVMLSHHNMLWNAWAGLQSLTIYSDDNFLSFLPLSHTLERSIGYYLPIMAGATITYARSIPQLAEDLLEQHPTVLISVPRIYERVYNRVQDQLKEKSTIARKLFNAAVNIGWLNFEHQQKRADWQAGLLLYPLLNHLLGKKIQDKLGGQLRIAICGGAPLSELVAKTFIALGIPIFQGYGLTETSPVVSVNTMEQNLPRSIGLPLRDVEVQFSDEGELLVKSPGVMQGYWQNEQATKDTIDKDGWLHTGDLGKQDDQSFIHITGRLKDIIVLSTGEKIPPADMEMAINADPDIEHALVIGEGKPFLSSIVVLAEQAWPKLAEQAGLLTADPQELKSNPEIIDLVLQKLGDCLTGFPSYAEILAVTLTLELWTVENDLATPTLKARRPHIIERYQAEIEQMYQGH